ncbi:hypothetical protein K503DRAFT_204068 [Rhizopogon vinicolor AM-OR11-026]|uniref:C2H2-type domain-containing protein n=1 Tax=Rhizopogon vinicolor AM-OR11-026 TaxID=1314800 RepID=A0A1B7MZ88_9AGAM|nr:hypothetical protein K503DRAFT_204068 [Rhizopogon vinicolor AM-OR11-026]
MQYPGPYSHNGHQTQQPYASSHHSSQSPSNSNSHTSGYPQQPGISGYPLNTPLPNGIIGNHSSSILQPVHFSSHSQHGAPPTSDARRPYYSHPADQPNAYFSSHQHSSAPSPQYVINPHAHLDHQTVRPHAQFIPTPSQAYQAYSSPTTSNQRVRPPIEPYHHMSPNPQHNTQRNSPPPALRSTHTPTSPSSNPALLGDRYPCDLCERSFTRSHDRRRHYETVHATTPVLHRCRYCMKDFSRADSLKRHIDNGCDEMVSRK